MFPSSLASVAPYPVSGMPITNYLGSPAVSSQGAGTTAAKTLTPQQEQQLLIVAGVVIVGGYLAFHLYHRGEYR